VCGECSVNSTCREFARTNHEYGFWGGESEDERHAAGFRLIAPIGVRARNVG
jgi:WhiB family redox-sensing transcriptional regulator